MKSAVGVREDDVLSPSSSYKGSDGDFSLFFSINREVLLRLRLWSKLLIVDEAEDLAEEPVRVRWSSGKIFIIKA